MANRNVSEAAAFALGNIGVMLRAATHTVSEAQEKMCNAAQKAALARIEICLVQAYTELNRLDATPVRRSSPITADVLPFQRSSRGAP